MEAFVNTHYSNLASAPNSSESAAHAQKAALSFGYSLEDLAALPAGSNMGLSCGNPIVEAGLREGETVVDLGCGAGFDVFQAARKVGLRGKVIGIDMSEAMISRAIASSRKPTAPKNVEFLLASITSLPLSAASVDCVTSNCVVNLVPEPSRALVFKEVFRVLGPGGRLAISDTLARKPMPKEMEEDIAMWVGCVAGAGTREDYVAYMEEAGFAGIVVVDKEVDLNVYKEGSVLEFTSADENTAVGLPSSCCGTISALAVNGRQPCCGNQPELTINEKPSCCSLATGSVSATVPDIDFNEWVGSFSIYAIKPGQ